MKKFKANCIIYSRVSTDQQSNESAIAELKRYAEYKEYQILQVFEEKISGTSKTADRVAFAELLNFCDQNQVDNILVWEISRLSRRGLKDILEIIDTFTNKQINIFALKENINTLIVDENGNKVVNPTSKMTLGILGSVAEFERGTIIARTKRGLRNHLMNQGSFSQSTYGYHGLNKKIAIEPNEALIVKRIYEMFLSGVSSPAIAKQLNYEGILTKKKKLWSDAQIRGILHNTTYYGDRVYNFGIVKVPAIVTKADYLKAQQIFDSNQNMNQDKAIFKNYLQGLVKCGRCGLSYFQHARQNRNDFSYNCMSTRKTVTGQLKENCGNKGININLLNSMVYNTLFSTLIKYDKNNELENLKDRFNSAINNQQKNIKLEIKIVKSDIEKNQKKLNRIKQLLFNNTIKESDYINESNIIESNIETLTNKLNDLTITESNLNKSNNNTFINSLDKYINQINKQGLKGVTDYFDMDLELYQYLIKTIVKSVIITNVSVSDNTLLTDQIKSLHHNRLTRININTLFDTNIFYTVTGFNQYSYQLINERLHKVDIIKEVSQ